MAKDWVDSCKVATTASVNLAAAPNIVDGISLAKNDRVLVKNQTPPGGHAYSPDNGVYVAQTPGTGSNGVWVRADDVNAGDEISSGLTVFVENGTLQHQTYWFLATTGKVVLGTTGLRFETKDLPRKRYGTAVMSGGSAVVTDTLITEKSLILPAAQASGSAIGDISVSTRTPGVSFTLVSESGSDDRVVGYEIIYL